MECQTKLLQHEFNQSMNDRYKISYTYYYEVLEVVLAILL